MSRTLTPPEQLGDIREFQKRMQVRATDLRRSSEARGGNISHEQRQHLQSAELAADDAFGYITTGEARDGQFGRDSAFRLFALASYWRSHTRRTGLAPELRAVAGDTSGDFAGAIFDNVLVRNMIGQYSIEPLASYFQTSTGAAVNVAGIDSEPTAALIGEADSFGESEPTFHGFAASAYKYGYIAGASEELVSDSAFDLVNQVFLIMRPVQAAIETHLAVGTGTGQPQGLTSDANTVKVTAASATAITATEVLDLYYALSSNYRNNASWIMAGSTLKALASLAVTVTEGVVHRLVHFPDVPGLPTILGRPVYVSDAMPTIAASHKSVYFGDVASNMLVRRVGSTQVKVLTELYTDSGQVGFRVSRRVDAKIVDPNAGVLLQQAAS